MIFKENDKAIFQQIADRLCEDIQAGKLVPEARIPSVRTFASEIEVNANTVMRAYEYLTTRGIIFNKRGIGYFIASDAVEKVERDKRQAILDGLLPETFRQLALLGITSAQLTEMYQSYLNREKKK